MKITTFCVLMLCAMSFMAAEANAQHLQQQAVVKTPGKQNLTTGERIPGDSISGAFVKIRDGNVQQSDANGRLSFPVPGGKYYIESVKYKDYQLVDSDELGREQAFSKDPKAIVIASIVEITEDKYNDERQMRELADRRYLNALSEIKRLQEEKKISNDSIQVLLSKLNASREKEEGYIKDFAERYSKIDFDQIDDFNNEWALYIRTGQLDKIDSLLNIRGDLSTMEKEYAAMCEEAEHDSVVIQHQEDLLRRNKETLACKEQKRKDKRAELADTYFKHYEAAVPRYKYDEAAACLEKRANLDPENAEWQFDAARYFDRQNQFKDSEKYYNRALNIYRRLAEEDPETYEPDLAMTLNNLVLLYSKTQRFDESETMYKEALEIYRRLAIANPQAYEPNVAMTLHNLASLYSNTQRFDESETMYKEALEIYRRLAIANPQAYEPDVAMTLNNLASLYSNTQRFDESETMYKEALEIYRRLAMANPQAYEPDMARTLNNLAVLYFNTQRFNESETMYKEALEIYRRLAMANPRVYELDLANVLYNLAGTYSMLDEHIKSHETYKELLPILKKYYNNSPERYNYAGALGNQSFQCMFMREFAKAEQYAREGIGIDPAQTFIYGNLASSLLLQGKYAEAEQIYRQYKDELKVGFLGDFKEFEEAGIIPDEYKADVERIKQLLNE